MSNTELVEENKSSTESSSSTTTPTTKQDEQQQQNDQQEPSKAQQQPQNQHYCETCKISSNSLTSYNQHLNGQKHKQKSTKNQFKNEVIQIIKSEKSDSTTNEAQQQQPQPVTTATNTVKQTNKFTRKSIPIRKTFKPPFYNNNRQNDHKRETNDQAKQTTTSNQTTKETFKCDICNLILTSKIVQEQHLIGRKHNKKLAKQQQQTSEQQQLQQQQTSQLTNYEFKCDLCNVVAVSSEQIYIHKAGKKHKVKLAKLKQKTQRTTSTSKESSEPSVTQQQQKTSINEDEISFDDMKIDWESYKVKADDLINFKTTTTNTSSISHEQSDDKGNNNESLPIKYDYVCKLCNKYMQAKLQLFMHLKSRKHDNKLKESDYEGQLNETTTQQQSQNNKKHEQKRERKVQQQQQESMTNGGGMATAPHQKSNNRHSNYNTYHHYNSGFNNSNYNANNLAAFYTNNYWQQVPTNKRAFTNQINFQQNNLLNNRNNKLRHTNSNRYINHKLETINENCNPKSHQYLANNDNKVQFIDNNNGKKLASNQQHFNQFKMSQQQQQPHLNQQQTHLNHAFNATPTIYAPYPPHHHHPHVPPHPAHHHFNSQYHHPHHPQWNHTIIQQTNPPNYTYYPPNDQQIPTTVTPQTTNQNPPPTAQYHPVDHQTYQSY